MKFEGYKFQDINYGYCTYNAFNFYLLRKNVSNKSVSSWKYLLNLLYANQQNTILSKEIRELGYGRHYKNQIYKIK